ncbi:MAG: DUF3179 domain-containing protein [Chloroflexi bacterium]|nr:DUF3179 domain-containing protein [Chloroflexota bacterium]MCI0899755.1 DUF3179 domain-containing protein [Chloroflexota bacterium]
MKLALPKKWLIAGTVFAAVLGIACGSQVGSSALSSPLNVADTSNFVADTGPGPSPIVEPDPLFRAELDDARFDTRGWDTDFSRHTVAFADIFSGGVGRDGIPPIDNPRFESIEEAEAVMNDLEPVVTFKINGEARAYPLAILTWHEIINDVVGGEPVTITFCPLCNSALTFKRTLEGRVFDFGVSGNLRNSDLIMWDRQTQTWWQQLTGEAIIGELAGHRLEFVPASIISWADFKAANPDSLVLSRNTGFDRPYGSNPYSGYDRVDRPPFLFDGDLDERLLPKERVAAFEVGGVSAAFPFRRLEIERVVNYQVNGTDVVVLFKLGTVSALDRALIIDSKDVGSTGVFEAHLDGRKLTFSLQDGEFVDDQTGSVWNILGEAVEGEMTGKSLTPIVHGNHFWFAWGAFNPETLIYKGVG